MLAAPFILVLIIWYGPNKNNKNWVTVKLMYKKNCKQILKDVLSSLRQYFASENPFKMTKNAFYFTLKLYLKLIFKFLS